MKITNEFISVSKTNDWSIATLFMAAGFVVAAGISIYFGSYLISLVMAIGAIGPLSIGDLTVFNFKTGSITKTRFIYFFIKFKTTDRFEAEQFNSVRLYQYSETGGSQFLVFSSRTNIREYHITLKSADLKTTFKAPFFQDYNEARSLVKAFRANWNYEVVDEIQKRLKNNKTRTRK